MTDSELEAFHQASTEKYLNQRIKHKSKDWTYLVGDVYKVIGYGTRDLTVAASFRHLTKTFIPMGQPGWAFIEDIERDYEFMPEP